MISALRSLAAAANRSRSLKEALHAAISEIADIFALDGARIFLFDDPAGELNLIANFERNGAVVLLHDTFKAHEGIVSIVAQSGKRAIFDIVEYDPLLSQPSHGAVSQRCLSRSFAAFPIPGKENTLGVITCIGMATRQLSPGAIDLLEAFADQLALVLESRRFCQRLDDKKLEIQGQAAELERASQALDQVAASLAGEVRPRLHDVIDYLELLQNSSLGKLNHDLADALKTIAGKASELLETLDNVCAPSKAGRSESAHK